LVNTGFVSQQKNLQGLKPKMRKLTGTFYLFKPIFNMDFDCDRHGRHTKKKLRLRLI